MNEFFDALDNADNDFGNKSETGIKPKLYSCSSCNIAFMKHSDLGDHKSTNHENKLKQNTILPTEKILPKDTIVTQTNSDEEPIDVNLTVQNLFQTCLLYFKTKKEVTEHTKTHSEKGRLPSILKNK